MGVEDFEGGHLPILYQVVNLSLTCHKGSVFTLKQNVNDFINDLMINIGYRYYHITVKVWGYSVCTGDKRVGIANFVMYFEWVYNICTQVLSEYLPTLP